MTTFYQAGRTHLYRFLFHKIVTVATVQCLGPIATHTVAAVIIVVLDEVRIVILVVLEKLETAVYQLMGLYMPQA